MNTQRRYSAAKALQLLDLDSTDDDCSDGDESMSEVGGDECIQDMNTDDEDIDAISENPDDAVSSQIDSNDSSSEDSEQEEASTGQRHPGQFSSRSGRVWSTAEPSRGGRRPRHNILEVAPGLTA